MSESSVVRESDEREEREIRRQEKIRDEKADLGNSPMSERREDDCCEKCGDEFADSDNVVDVWSEEDEYEEDDEYCSRYSEEYAGSYAQQEMGYDDDAINYAFEGDPDNYWNID